MKTNRLFSLILALALLTSLLAGCGSSSASANSSAATSGSEAAESADNSSISKSTTPAASAIADDGSLIIPETDTTRYPLDDGTNTLSFWYGSWESDYMTEIHEQWNVQAAEDYTGVKVEYTTCGRANETEATNLMYASGTYPDMINFMGTDYKSGHEAAVEDDIYLDLTDYVEQYAPNYNFLIQGSEEIRRSVLSDNGMLCGFFQINSSIQPPFQGLYVRGDWLDALGMRAPTTYDEIKEVMIAFRDNYGTSFGISPDATGVSGPLAYGLDITGTNPNNNGGYILKDGVVSCSYVSDQFRTYLTYLHDWYAEGLINEDFISGTETDAYLTGKCGVFTGMAEDIYNLPPQASDPEFRLTACTYPTVTGNEEVHLGDLGGWVGNAGVAVTTACEDIELACRWLDFFYSSYAYEINNYGQEGVTFQYDENGEVTYTELLTDNPDGLTLMTARGLYCNSGAGNRAWVYDWSATQIGAPESLQETVTAWETDGAYVLPQMATLTAEESEDTSSKIGDCSTYWGEMILRFIFGELELTDENWNEYVDHVYSLGLQDAIDARQASVDRYYAR